MQGLHTLCTKILYLTHNKRYYSFKTVLKHCFHPVSVLWYLILETVLIFMISFILVWVKAPKVYLEILLLQKNKKNKNFKEGINPVASKCYMLETLQCVYSNLTGPMYIDWNTHTSNFFTNIRLLYQNLNLYLGFQISQVNVSRPQRPPETG